MGLFRRREAPAEPAASPEPAERPIAPAPADPGPPAWATLPPLTPTVGAPASTFKIGAAVKEDLVALDSPRLSHGMGHLVSSDGPPGVISGLTRTSVQRQASASAGGPLDMPMAPMLGPEHARTIADDGFTRADVQRFVYEHARLSLGHLKLGGMWGMHDWPRWMTAVADPATLLPQVPSPEDIYVVVAGGSGKHSAVVPNCTFSRAVSRPIG